uniref:Uncharacterized protein n=1 Tax=Anguilla anguilla TaxID=7936 RepID=A0A0E9U6P1_ANGAN
MICFTRENKSFSRF